MERREDLLTPGLLARFRATVDAPEAELGIHWCLCLPDAPTAVLGIDGHPPHPVDLPRRMWAGSAVEFHAPLAPGMAVTRETREVGRTEKTGGSGRLVFVELEHEVTGNGVLAVRERQTIVYRDNGSRSAVPPAAAEPDDGWDTKRSLVATAPLLFRYSALTFNTHRIHYDRPYVREVEGYRDLVVHGPLLATLLLDVARAELGRLTGFSFRAVAPAHVDQPLRLECRGIEQGLALRVRADDMICMTAVAAAP